MVVARWWSQRRFGLSFEASLATVPSWSPVGHEAAWYRAHVDPATRDLRLHPGGLAEAVHHHRERWAHVESYDDFLPFLHFDEFDADAWVGLARDTGAGYALITAKHHDGWCWWDAPGTERTVLHDGPRRNVLGEFAAACERGDLVFGATYSLLDWGDERYPGVRYVDEVVHPQVLDLVERYGAHLLWGDAHWGAGGEHWRSTELLAAARRAADDLVVNDRWWADDADVTCREHVVPSGIVDEPWELRRPLGSSASFNRAEPPERLMSARQIVALLTEVVAKGGHLLLQIGPDAAGRIPDHVAERLRAAGGWIRRNQDLIDRSRPWQVWGDDDVRYLDVDGLLHAVDVAGQGRFADLNFERGKVVTIETPDGRTVVFDQTDTGVQLARQPRRTQRLPTVYRVTLEPPPPAPIQLFPTAAGVATDLAPLVAGAGPGSIVQLGDGEYSGPAVVPRGVTLRGLGPDRTTVTCTDGAAIVLGDGSRLEHCSVSGGGRRIGALTHAAVEITGSRVTVLGCEVAGHLVVRGSKARITSCTATGVAAQEADRVEILRSTLIGVGVDVGVEITGGAGHVIDGCEISGHLAAVSLTGTVAAAVRHCRLSSRWWGVRLVDTEASEVTGNAFAGMTRAIDVDGGADAAVTGNAAADADSGCLLQHGASNAVVAGNYWERCRVGLLAWEAGEFRERANTATDLGEADSRVVIGP